MSRTHKGFTLVELLIVVTIIGILAAIAYPSYNEYVRKGKRAEAKTRLLQIAQLEERFFSENNTYTVSIATLLGTTGVVYSSETNNPNSGYQITIAAGSGAGQTIANSFTLTATPQLNQTADTKCGNLTLAHTGAKGKTGTGSLSDCWN